MSYYPEPDSHIRDKVKVVLDFTNYATKKRLEHTKGVDTSDLATKKFVALKSEADKLDINKLVNVSTSLNNLKTKVDGKWKTVPVYLKKLSDAVNNQVKNIKYNTPKTKVNKLDKKIPDSTTLKLRKLGEKSWRY